MDKEKLKGNEHWQGETCHVSHGKGKTTVLQAKVSLREKSNLKSLREPTFFQEKAISLNKHLGLQNN